MNRPKNLKQASEEAGAFLAAFPGLDADTDVRQLAGHPWPPLTVGAVYALWAVANDLVAMSSQYTPEEIAQAILK